MFSLALHNPKSATNLAALIRAAGCFGADSVFYSGSRIHHAIKHRSEFRQDTKNFRDKIPLIEYQDIFDKVSSTTQCIAIELVEGATPLPTFEHPQDACYIFGPEDGSLPQDIVDRCDHTVFIPCQSNLNLAACASVILYDRQLKLGFDDSMETLNAARDNNNRLKVSSS